MTRNSVLVGIAALALAGTAAIQAQPGRPAGDDQRPRMAQGRGGQGPGFRGGGPGRPGGSGMALHGLDLTEEQKAQVRAIHEKARQDVEAVLTPAQLEKLKARRGGRGGRGGGN